MSKWPEEIEILSDFLYETFRDEIGLTDEDEGMFRWLNCDGFPEDDAEVLILASQVLEEQ